MKILLAENDLSFSEALRSTLTFSGYDVAVAYDGEQAIIQAKEQLPDIIILDVMLDKVNGYEVCRHLRDDPKTGNIPIIIATALGQIENERLAREVGANDYIRKPFEKSEILAKILALHIP